MTVRGRQEAPSGSESQPAFLVGVLWLLASAFAMAAELNFSAEVDRTSVGLGEQLQLTVAVSGTNIGGAPRPQLPSLTDFTELGSTSSQSTNISFVNGRMTQEQTISFIYFLSPKRVGDLVIGPCRLEFKGSVYQTQPIAIKAAKAGQAPPLQQQPAQPGRSPFDWDPFGWQQHRRAQARGAVSLAASADRTTVYQGEQVNISFTFYTQAQVANLGVKDTPGFTGFWTEKMFDAKELSYREATRDGQRYSAALLKQVALFPTQAGDLKVDKMTLTGERLVSGGFFFDNTEPFEVSSDPITIHVKPLPDAGSPPDFCGGVGSFSLSAELNKDSSLDGEPLSLAIKVSGTGNVGLVGEPKLPPVAGLKLLQPEAKQSITVSGGRIAGSRTFSYPVIPTADGRFAIPGISMSFFDPHKGGYYTLAAERLEFVAVGASGKVPMSEGRSGVKTLGSDIAHIKPTGLRGPGSSILPGASRWAWVSYPVGLLLFAAGVLLGQHRRRLEQDRGYARRRRSSRLVKRRLADATRLLAAGKERDFYAALARAVLGYAGDRFNLDVSGMTGDEIRAELERREVSGTTVSELLDVVSRCDSGRFSPGMASCSPKETLELAQSMLEKL